MISEGTQGLAIYGSVVGTVALGINLFNFLHSKQKDSVRLSIECKEDEEVDNNIQEMNDNENQPEHGRSSLAIPCTSSRLGTLATQRHIFKKLGSSTRPVQHIALLFQLVIIAS